MFVITGQQGENYGLSNRAIPEAQIYHDQFGKVLFAGHKGKTNWDAVLGCYQSEARAAEVASSIIAKFHDYKTWLAAGHVVKTFKDIAEFQALQLNRYALPKS